ncbi:MAG: TIGR03936 family radical SAM-associated protein [Acidimicrobiales bacterium]
MSEVDSSKRTERRPAEAIRSPRLRLRYSKLGKVRFTSHRDVARIWERALRRSGIRVAWSSGFSPHPLLAFGLALPTGCESLGEYVDVRLRVDPCDGLISPGPQGLMEFTRSLSAFLPDGIDVQAAALCADGTGSLQEEVTSCSWEMEVRGVSEEQLAERVDRLLGASRVFVTRERKGIERFDDIRPQVLDLLCSTVPGVYAGSSSSPRARLFVETATRPRGLRPMELIKGLGDDLVLSRACRTNQWIDRPGTRSEPLDAASVAPVPLATRTKECVS